MSCFQIPMDICHQLDTLIANFWWGQKGEERKIHWLQWRKLCKPKEKGGLGFREISVFNKAMLAKQGWRLLQDDGSLLTQTLKAKYYPNGNFLTASIGYKPSFTWRSIVAGREIIQKGTRWLIGNGAKIRIWKDPWLPNFCDFRPVSSYGDWPDNMTVRDLFCEDQQTRNEEIITRIFTPEEANEILSIPLRNSVCEDRISWHYTAFGQYSVKSGYKLAP
ncbi:hypothetical protein DH2020_047112 [Rehmannia glutinosa]|uniref:Uncharacterized protein n=1 Tax=Rehmannia glutinosa TaxID=99300 RepID=A0ABR0U9I0_REHGL